MMIRAINYALLGINRNRQQALQSARSIAGGAYSNRPGVRAPAPRSSHISGEFVQLMAAERGVEANVAALKAANRTVGALVNLSA